MYNGFSTYTKEGDVLARIEDTHSSLDVDMVDTENWMRIKHIFFCSEQRQTNMKERSNL